MAYAGSMTTKPPEGQLYRTGEGSDRPAGPVDLGTTIPQELSYNQAYHPRNGAEMNSDQSAGLAGQPPAPAVGTVVVHRNSGRRGVVQGHERHGYSGTAMPQVQWAGEDRSWPQGVSANALRVVGSTPEDLYTTNQGADSRTPLRGSTGAL